MEEEEQIPAAGNDVDMDEEEGMPGNFLSLDRFSFLENMQDVPDESWTVLGGHAQDVFTLSVSADGKTLLSGGEDDKALVWDLETLGCAGKGVCLSSPAGY